MLSNLQEMPACIIIEIKRKTFLTMRKEVR